MQNQHETHRDMAHRIAHPVIAQPQSRERYQRIEDNRLIWTADAPVSTFAVDVDTAAYANLRRFLNQGQLPPPDAVRVEELVNYFTYDYAQARDRDRPFASHVEVAPSPWNPDRHLLHVGINGWVDTERETLPPANLVFLIDVSGSMRSADKLDLLKTSMQMLVRRLRPQDHVGIVVYAGSSGAVLEPTSGRHQSQIAAAIAELEAGGSTNGAAGIELAYQLAQEQFDASGINRIILATDGDFNVGPSDVDTLKQLIERKRRSGIALTVLGFGQGNYNDHLMQTLAQHGNGNAAYIDSLREARKVLVEELAANLQIIAKDMKVQVEFNPARVANYRLIGYETRHLEREDFNNDRVDAGEVGAGHTVTALYEITLTGHPDAVDPLRYGSHSKPSEVAHTDELAFLRIRYKAPNGQRSKLLETPVAAADIARQLHATSDAYRFSAAVAWLGQYLKGSKYVAQEDLEELLRLARGAIGDDEHGHRHEFLNLVRLTQELANAQYPALTQR
ncbi:MAG: VWA domain-containing protein [Pseudomonadota bacterium]